MSPSLKIASTGMYLPERVLSNAELEKLVDTSDEWILSRTGISERRIANKDELASDMGAEAAKEALEKGGVSPEDVDLIMVATITPDATFPATACILQDKIGAVNAAAFDLQAACTGFVYGMTLANALITSGTYRNILLIGAERLSSIVDWTDRNTCVLFGDGAGAALLQASDGESRLLASDLGANGKFGEILFLNNGRKPHTFQSTDREMPRDFLNMTGREVFKKAVTAMVQSCDKTLEKAGLSVDDIRCVVSHQANIRIIEALRERLKVPKEKCFVNVNRYGNISAACIPIALNEAQEEMDLRRGDAILMVAFGGGLTWGSAVVKW